MVKISFQLQKRLKNDPKISIFLKSLYDLKNVSRHFGGHYNIKIKHFEHFSGGPPPCQVGLILKCKNIILTWKLWYGNVLCLSDGLWSLDLKLDLIKCYLFLSVFLKLRKIPCLLKWNRNKSRRNSPFWQKCIFIHLLLIILVL